MLSKKFVYMFLLVLLLSMGMVVGQEPQKPEIALILGQADGGLRLSVAQVGESCVPSYQNGYTLYRYDPTDTARFVPVHTTSPFLHLGDMGGRPPEAFYFYPRLKSVKGTGLEDIWPNGVKQGVYLAVPFSAGFFSPVQSPACQVRWFYSIERPLLIVGKAESYAQVFRGQGAAIQKVSLNPQTGEVWATFVAFHPTRATVFVNTEDANGRQTTNQVVLELQGTGSPEILKVPMNQFPRAVIDEKIVYVHLFDTMTLISTTQVLFDPNRIVLDKNGNYIPPEYYKLFVGDDKQ